MQTQNPMLAEANATNTTSERNVGHCQRYKYNYRTQCWLKPTLQIQLQNAMLAKANATDRNAKPANGSRLTSCDSVRHSLKFNQIRLNSPQQSVAIPSE